MALTLEDAFPLRERERERESFIRNNLLCQLEHFNHTLTDEKFSEVTKQ